MLDAKEAYKILNDIRSVGETANEATDGWFDYSLVENIEDYLDALADANKELIGIGKYRIEINNAIQEAAKEMLSLQRLLMENHWKIKFG